LQLVNWADTRLTSGAGLFRVLRERTGLSGLGPILFQSHEFVSFPMDRPATTPSLAAALDHYGRTLQSMNEKVNTMATSTEAATTLVQRALDNNAVLTRIALVIQGIQANQDAAVKAAVEAAVAAAIAPLEAALDAQAAVLGPLEAILPADPAPAAPAAPAAPVTPTPDAGTITAATPAS
jgi:hypothetical protein